MQSEAQSTYIYRITHVENIPWIAANGLHCQNSCNQDPNFRPIGIQNLINKRSSRPIPVNPGGMLSDYIPFYFTSRSPMLYNIKTGRHVNKLPMSEIAIVVTSLERLQSAGVPFLFTDRHAILSAARFTDDLRNLGWIDWDIIRRSDFQHDINDPGKVERYQAEALIHKSCSFSHVEAIIVSDANTKLDIESKISRSPSATPVFVSRRHFF
jgi:hypothetical protein